ncbi:MAG: AraC family transcriptional regulator [Clostridia bacterium]|nr:AraC family transcriptional regulator [Clostridia bacterium]
MTPSWHDYDFVCTQNKLFYILEGEIAIVVNKQEIIAKAGDMVLIPAGTKHDYYLTPLKYAQKFWLHFDLTIDKRNLFDDYTFPYTIAVTQNEYVYSLFEQLVNLKANNALEQTLTRSGLLCSLLSYYFNHCSISLKTNDNHIWSVIEYINNNYIEKLTLTDLATRANLSPNQFLRRFESIMGVSPIQYVNYLRIDRAKHLLEKTNKSISQILEEVGFYDSAHFSKAFKSYYGYSPRQYREIVQEKSLK